MKWLFQPAFNLLFQRRTQFVIYLLTAALISIAQVSGIVLVAAVSTPTTDWTLAIAGCAIFIFGLYSYVIFGVAYKRSLSALARLLGNVSLGDLSLHFMPGWGTKSEGQNVWTELNKMNKAFPNIVRQVRASAHAIAQGSGDIASGYADLADRTEEQAATLRKTATSMEELAATVRQNADNCREANQAMHEIGGRADEATQSMQQVNATMSHIETSTRQMRDCVSIIEGIAFQTNILALNAAVEAARAGDQGQGFAVVAAEVRALAQRSAKATQEIKNLIGASFDKVTEGAAAVKQAEDAVNRAMTGIRQVVDLINEVASASVEQNTGVQQIGKALTQLEAVTQQNAMFVNEGFDTAKTFEQEANRLVQVVEVFKLQDRTTLEDSLSVGNRETLAKNYSLGSLGRKLMIPLFAIAVRMTDRTKTWVLAFLLFTGPVLTFASAQSIARSGADGVFSSVLTGMLTVIGLLTFLLAFYIYIAKAKWQSVTAGFMERLTKKLAAGDLTWSVRVDTSATGARHAGNLINLSMAKIQENFSKVVRQVRSSAINIAKSSQEVARGYTSLSQRTEEQASTLEETSAGMEELSATVKQNAQTCNKANGKIGDVGERAEESARAMQQVTNTMTGIESSAARMTEFVGIIEGIAFQTNLLALNAAVEAARAGEQGRGFAVVAAEVRALAQRSAKATEEIKSLIAASSQNVSEGATQVSQAEQSVTRAVEGVRHAMDLIATIAAASAEQNAGMQMMVRSLSELETTTQQNNALVDEGAAMAVSFEQEASRLTQMVEVFRLATKDDASGKHSPSTSNRGVEKLATRRVA